jgi:hypothetical protein
MTTTVLYSSSSNSSTQSDVLRFSFSKQERQATFADSTFLIPAGSAKWTISINSSTPFPDGLNMTYLLNGFALSRSANATIGLITTARTQANITTYYLSLSSSPSSSLSPKDVIIQLDVFDVVLVDGRYLPLDHSVSFNTSSRSFLLNLPFPPFTATLEYDPTLGLGVLLGSGSGHDGGGGDQLPLIIGAAVGIPLAVLVVGSLLVGLTAWSVWQRKKWKRRATHRGSINFDSEL